MNLDDSHCTFSITGTKHMVQGWYSCDTCTPGGVPSLGCCDYCARTCHQGHSLSERRVSNFYCDCDCEHGTLIERKAESEPRKRPRDQEEETKEEDDKPKPKRPRFHADSKEWSDFCQNVASFAVRFASETVQDSRGNLAQASWSVFRIMWNLYQGSWDETAAQIRQALMGTKDDKRAVDMVNDMMGVFDRMQKAEFNLPSVTEAMSIWTKLALRLSFTSQLKAPLDCEVQRVDQLDAKDINEWVSKATSGALTQVVKDLTERDQFVLVHAMTFAGKWALPFDKAKTRLDATFTTAEGKEVKCAMMRRKFDSVAMISGRDDQIKAIALPYLGPGLVAILVLPGENKKEEKKPAAVDLASIPIHRLYERFTCPPGGRVTGTPSSTDALSCSRGKVLVDVPRFVIESDLVNVADVAKRMGIVDAFDPAKANLSGIRAENDVALGKINTKCRVEFDEEGTRAAAATAAVGVKKGIERQPPSFLAHRPFGLFVVNQGLVILSAIVNDPSKT